MMRAGQKTILISAALLALAYSSSVMTKERCLTLHQARKIWPTQHLIWKTADHCWRPRDYRRVERTHDETPPKKTIPTEKPTFGEPPTPLWPPAVVPHGMDLMAAITRQAPPRVITRIVREEVPVPGLVDEREYNALDAEEDMREMRARERVWLMAIAAWFGATTVMGGAALWMFARSHQ
jgi:hypothetical protein